MFGATLEVPVYVGNLLIWLFLETLVLGLSIQWTKGFARILVKRRLMRGAPLALSHTRSWVDRLPCNGDLVSLDKKSMAFLTSIRLLFVILVAVTGIGIDSARIYTMSVRTTHVIDINSASFSGASLQSEGKGSTPDIAASACEDLDERIIAKTKAFIAGKRFSCNDGKFVNSPTRIAEVVWLPSTVSNIIKGKYATPRIRVSGSSKISPNETNPKMAKLVHTKGTPFELFIWRTICPSQEKRPQCPIPGALEYLIVSNNEAMKIGKDNVTVAYVIRKRNEITYLRDTNNVLAFTDQDTTPQLSLGRSLLLSLTSVQRNNKAYFFYGPQKKVTKVRAGFDYLVVSLLVCSIFPYFAALACVNRNKDLSDFDPFSPLSMFRLGQSFCDGRHVNSRLPIEDVKIYVVENEADKTQHYEGPNVFTFTIKQQC